MRHAHAFVVDDQQFPLAQRWSLMAELGGYSGLFFSAFVAATLPTAQRLFLVDQAFTDAYPVWMLFAVATVGKVLGFVVNWLLGCGIEQGRERPWFPVNPESLGRAQRKI